MTAVSKEQMLEALNCNVRIAGAQENCLWCKMGAECENGISSIRSLIENSGPELTTREVCDALEASRYNDTQTK